MKIYGALVIAGLCGVCLGAGGGVSTGGSSGGGSVTETEETRLFVNGRPLSLTCTYNVTNLPTSWTKDGTEIVESEHIKLFPNTTLHITSTEEGDIGEYTCKHGSMLEPKTFNVVALSLQKRLPKSTTVLENDKLSLTCQVDGKPHPTIQWLKDGEPAQESVNSSRLVLSENEAGISNGSLLINPVLKSDSGNYICLISQYSIQLNTTTEVRVKDIYAALWPFLGIVAEVVILCTIIYIHERRRIRKNLEEADIDNKATEQKIKEENKENDVRQRK
ncbi:basigin-like [Eriocheir sinensis]|uniref:basigin-like n=1 Tax=Eriocheir sinensis TaxID=95602 RepID=UPI0021C6B0B3|nr:basigin-like [Eriocheir sinensis]